MHATNSFLYTVIERIRGYLDDPDLDAKYSDDFIIRHVIMPAMTSVVSRVNNSLSNPVVCRLRVTLAADQQYYQLPPTVGEVWAVCEYNSETGYIEKDTIPRSFYSPHGPNWSLEGNQLSVRPIPKETQDIDIFYTHSGDLMLHYGEAGKLNTDRDGNVTELTIGTATLGGHDLRPNAYAGSMLRVFSSGATGSTTEIVEERLIESSSITSFKGSTNITLTTRLGFNFHSDATAVKYEIAPFGLQAMYEAVAAAGSLKLAAYKKVSGTHYQMIQMQYKDAMKTVCDHYANMQMRLPKHYDKDTWDNYDNLQVLP
jgi:hypothetical protein|tara:strand:- start:351 stop:1292 length:942 start_codon:yes stop_codon:yes gene_type:complete